MNDVLLEKSFDFAVRVVNLSEYLNNEKHEYVLSKKILDSGTNIGLFIEEGKQGEDRPDFVQKYSIANKEAFKTNFLLRLLNKTKFISDSQAESMVSDCEELQKLLIASLKTARKNHEIISS
jgi:four helix bundle protein